MFMKQRLRANTYLPFLRPKIRRRIPGLDIDTASIYTKFRVFIFVHRALYAIRFS